MKKLVIENLKLSIIASKKTLDHTTTIEDFLKRYIKVIDDKIMKDNDERTKYTSEAYVMMKKRDIEK